MIELIASLLPYIITGLFGLAVVLLLIAIQQLRRGRTGPYWRLRRAAGQRGGQLFVLSILLFGIAIAIAVFSGLADLAYQRLTTLIESDPDAPRGVVIPTISPTPRFSPTPTATLTPTVTATYTPAPITETAFVPETLTPTETATLTLTPTLTFTPTATFENVLVLTPPPSTQQPRRGAKVTIRTATNGVDTDGNPIGESEFVAGTQRIYLFFDFLQMDDGIVWTRILYRDGIAVQGGSYLWSLGQAGSGFFFFGSDSGYAAGKYTIRLFLGETQINEFEFSILAS